MSRIAIFLDRLKFRWLSCAALLTLLAFAGAYDWAGRYGQGLAPTFTSTTSTVNYLQCLYFSVVTFSSLGYGDFRPEGISRLFSSLEVLIGLAFLGLAIAKLSSARQSYYTARLFASDAQERLDKFSTGFDELAREASSADAQHLKEIVRTINHRCVALLNYFKFETQNGPFFSDVPIRPVRRVVRYFGILLGVVVRRRSELPNAIGWGASARKLLNNTMKLGSIIEENSKDDHLVRDSLKLRRDIQVLKSLD